jgi:hypothetical protein
MLMSAFMASAALETKTVGPYNVSFDMNTSTNYSILFSEPIRTSDSSVYLMLIKTNNTTMSQIAIIDNENITDSTLSTGKIIAEKSLANFGYSRNMSSVYTDLDGKKAIIVTGLNQRNMRLFLAGYWLDSKDCQCGPVSVGKTKVEVTSSYSPVQTWNLLSKLHIEKSKKKEQKQPKTIIFVPPK